MHVQRKAWSVATCLATATRLNAGNQCWYRGEEEERGTASTILNNLHVEIPLQAALQQVRRGSGQGKDGWPCTGQLGGKWFHGGNYFDTFKTFVLDLLDLLTFDF